MIITAKRRLERAMEQASSYEEWKEAALALDQKKDLDRWKIIDQSRRYDYVSIRVRLDRLRALRSRHDNRGLLFTLNEGIHGNMGGMGRSSLYEKANFGTKKLVADMWMKSLRRWNTWPNRKSMGSVLRRNWISSDAPITALAGPRS